MKTIKTELANHLLDLINDEVLTNGNHEDWHFHAFNEDYYIIGYYQASEWLKRHDMDAFETIGICQQYEIDHFGESRIYDNSEQTVNMLVYIIGEELLNELNADTVEELEQNINNFLND